MRQWLHDLRDAGIPVVVVSNNKYERVKRAVENLGLNLKPSLSNRSPLGLTVH